jgi:hypothetical protein
MSGDAKFDPYKIATVAVDGVDISDQSANDGHIGVGFVAHALEPNVTEPQAPFGGTPASRPDCFRSP